MTANCLSSLWQRILPIILGISVEPVFFLDGFAYSIMTVQVEYIQFDKIRAGLNATAEIAASQGLFANESTQNERYDSAVSAFKRNDGIITSVIPLFYILFIGAWSDRYGRKIPLCMTLFAHIMYSGGYLINALNMALSVKYLYIVGFLDSLGGGAVAFLTVANAYMSDVTTTEERTARVAFANSLWFLGGPLGTLCGAQIYKHSGYLAVFATSLCLYIIAIIYTGMYLPESYGPFVNNKKLQNVKKAAQSIRFRDTVMRIYGMSQKTKKTFGETKGQVEKPASTITYKKMIKDFFDIKRVILSFKCVFRKREGFTRLFIFLLILSIFLRKIGRGAYASFFTNRVLTWDAEYYGYWLTYKNLVATLGSLFAVPILSTKLRISDSILAMIGSLSSVIDYLLYGLVTKSTEYFMWIAPAAGLLINSCNIAMRVMMSKYVNSDELGKVSAVTGTIEGIVPVVSTSIYSAITNATFETFPTTQYFFGSGCNVIMLLIFIFIIITDKGGRYDFESARPIDPETAVKEKTIVIRKDSKWVRDEERPNKFRLASILLTAFNFSIEIPSIEKMYSQKNRKKLSTDSTQNGWAASIPGLKLPKNHKAQTCNGASTKKKENSIPPEPNKKEEPKTNNEGHENKDTKSAAAYSNVAFAED